MNLDFLLRLTNYVLRTKYFYSYGLTLFQNSININHVYALLHDNHNYKDVFYDRLSNQYIRNACDFHNLHISYNNLGLVLEKFLLDIKIINNKV